MLPPHRAGALPETSPSPSLRRTQLRWALYLFLSLALLWFPSGVVASTFNCHKTCICASNIVSCSKRNLTTVPTGLPLYTAVLDLSYNHISRLRAEWTTVKLTKLHNLLLSHNGLHFLSSEAFLYVKQVRYLDLSSNNLRQLDEFIFELLGKLEVLLLYNNHISQIDRSAFHGLHSLQKLYLSQNKISRFPLELVKDETSLEKLSLMDVSSNRIKVLPIEELQVLPAWIKNGLYFHNNPLICDCSLYSLLAHWHIRRLDSALDFEDEYTCSLPGPQKGRVGVLDLNKDCMNCSTFHEADEEAWLEQTLILRCDTKHRDLSKTWVMPGNVVVTEGANQTAKVLPDGSLQISPVKPEDSGTYACYAVSEALNETLYVLVKVHNLTEKGKGETLNTAYTTLVGCVTSVVLVLIYLYLTPCRCFCCPKINHQDSIHSSMLSAAPSHRMVNPSDREGDQGENGTVNPSDREGDQGENGTVNPSDREGDQGENGTVNPSDREGDQGENGTVNPSDREGDQGENGTVNPSDREGDHGENWTVNPSDREGDQGEMDEEGGLLGKGRRKKYVAESISLVFSDTP